MNNSSFHFLWLMYKYLSLYHFMMVKTEMNQKKNQQQYFSNIFFDDVWFCWPEYLYSVLPNSSELNCIL